MKHILQALAVAVIVFAATNALAAASVTEPQVKQFVGAIEDVEAFADQIRAEGKEKALQDAASKENDEEFKPYEKGVTFLKKTFPDDYKKLGDIVGKHGFASQEEWAQISDDVMHAYMALKIAEKNPELLKQKPEEIPEEVKKNMTPQILEQTERMQRTMKAASDTTPESREAVKLHLAELDAWMERSRAKSAPQQGVTLPQAPAPQMSPVPKTPVKPAE